MHQRGQRAARADGAELSVVADENELGADLGCGVDEPRQVLVVGHPCLIEHHEGLVVEGNGATIETDKQGSHKRGLDARAFADRASSLTRRGGAEDPVALGGGCVAYGPQRGGLA